MELSRLDGTCSMYELKKVDNKTIMNNSFELVLNGIIEEHRLHENQVIIHNTNYNWFCFYTERRKLYKLGFRQIGSYNGRSGMVYILLKKIK